MTLDISANYKCPRCGSLKVYQLLSPNETLFYCRGCATEIEEVWKVGGPA